MNIFQEAKKIILGPECPLCGKRKSFKFKEKHYCQDCEGPQLDVEILKNL